MEGYKNGKPDVEWWRKQIEQGVDDRKKRTCETLWPTWREYYRSDFGDGVFPKNIFFMMRRTMVPRIYFRNPSVSVVSAKPGQENQAISKILERIDNKMLRSMNFKTEMKKIVDKTWMTGTGIGKLGFGGEFSPTPDVDGTIVPVKNGQRVEYRTGIEDNMPWFRAISTNDFVLPAGISCFEDAYFVAHRVWRSLDEVRADTRLKNTSKINATQVGKNWKETKMGHVFDPRPHIEMFEIRDKRNRKVMVISPDLPNDVFYFEEDEFQIGGSVPFYTTVFNEDDETFWGVPDAKILEPYQLEINEIKTQMMKHRRLSIIKILIEKGGMSAEEAQKMLEEEVNAVVEVDDISKVLQMQLSKIPPDLFAMEDAIMQDVRETMGFSRNAFGEFAVGSADRTATEAQIVRQASEIRVDERRDKLADTTVQVTRGMNSILFNHWNNEEVVDVIGPDGLKVWVKFQTSALREGKFDIKVDPDTSVPETKQIREQKSVQLYQLLLQNPIVAQDPLKVEKITRFLIHEQQGYALDDLLDPAIPGGSEDNPVDLQGYGKILQQGSQGQQSQLSQLLG